MEIPEDQIFVVIFEDPQVPRMTFTGEGAGQASQKYYDQAKLNWACWLMIPAQRLAASEAEVKRLREVVSGIANADQSTWESEYRSPAEFKAWAQNVTRHALNPPTEPREDAGNE